MQAKMRRIWWACKDKGCGWAMLAWDKVCLPTGMEGVGFRHIRLFNIALLGRQAIFTIGGLDGRIINNDYSNCIDCRKEAMRGKEEAAWVIWERPKSLSKEFRIHNMINRPILLPHIVDKKWKNLPIDKVKINFDAAIINDKIGFDILTRDSIGFVMGRSYGFK
ncbi:hypothetical protein Goshw_024842 [Gossypium schwendimanii]|uniref:Reverse transcriptase zinc-binding domain-containing protein n=1 Tax=Gossypium schwendimanii TaxID=34291 RepID=A0A7J9MDM0_GOSSC|nr:hypothetical protein [Gossypium schwendimanii]